jgi:transglutaminase-like putative cysteine protease
MRKLFYLLLLAPVCLRAQNFSAALIPDSLRKDARVVVREDEFILEIKSPGKAVEKEHEVYTILNSNGDNLGGYALEYNKFESISDVSGILYDSLGKFLRKAKRKDMQDRSYADGYSLATDDRYLAYNFYYKVYPYTVDYEKEIDREGFLVLNEWLPLMNSGISTQHSKYTIIAPKDYKVRYMLRNGAPPPIITEDKDKKIYTWEAKNLPALHNEPFGPRWREIAPYVMMAPSDFEEQGYKGNMSTWTDYGKFISQLRAGRDVLPDNIKQQVHEITDTIKDPRSKVYALYRYLQQNTHYISIQLGIGGLQPFSAEYVATKKYGDCKALSNYMIALLKEAGINGKYVEILAGEDAPPMIDNFSCRQFNHAISCVPMGRDTIWLECTDQTVSPGYMGTFTGGRKAILLDDDGGHVVKTPSYTASDNTQCRVTRAQLSADGNLDANVSTVYQCVRQDRPHSMMDEMSAEDRTKHLNRLFSLPTYSVDKSHYDEKKGPMPVVAEDLHVVAPNYAGVSGKRLFISPNIFDRSRIRLPADSIRKYDFINDEAHTDIDSVVIAVPSGYQVEAMPKDVAINGHFGSFRCSVRFENDKLVYYRFLQQSEGRYPPAEYTALVKFYEQLYQSDNQRVVLVKKE